MRKILEFTLVELLIVIAVIAILASLLFPALSQAKEKSRQILCVNNLRQCDIATLSYSNDYGGYAPAHYQVPYDRGSGAISDIRWTGFLYLGNYLQNVMTAWCPTDHEASTSYYPTVATNPFEQSTFTYGMLTSLGTPTSYGAWYKIAAEKNPSQTIVYADSVYFFTFGGYNKWCHTSQIDTNAAPTAETNRTVHLRHPGATGNAAFADGHAASLRAAEFKEYGITGGRSKNYLPQAF